MEADALHLPLCTPAQMLLSQPSAHTTGGQRFVTRASRDISHSLCPSEVCLEVRLSNEPAGNPLLLSSDSLVSPSLSR